MNNTLLSNPNPFSKAEVPRHYEEVYTEEQIRHAIGDLAGRLVPWVDSCGMRTGQQPLFMAVLRGGFLFLADLVRRMPRSVQPGFIQCRSYDSQSNQAGANLEMAPLFEDVAGRDVLLVDDICDSGRTLQVLTRQLLSLGASEVRSAVLIYREPGIPSFIPDEYCFRYKGPEWFVGYGMDDSDHRMNLPSVYRMMPQPTGKVSTS